MMQSDLIEDLLPELRLLADKQEIAALLAGHSRAVDNADAEQLRGIYHPDGEVAYGFYEGEAGRFAEILTGPKLSRPRSLHRTSNMWVEVKGDHGWAESYIIACSGSEEPEGQVGRLIGGRYLDRFEKRSGEWRLSHRTYVMDWNINRPLPAFPAGQDAINGIPGPGDPGLALFATYERESLSPEREERVAQSERERIEQALAKQELAELNFAFCRALDRADAEMLSNIWGGREPCTRCDGPSGLLVNDPVAPGAIERRSSRSVSDLAFTIASTGATATGCGRMIGYRQYSDASGGEREQLCGGRFHDAYVHENGRWHLAERMFVEDWIMDQPSTGVFGEGMYASLKLVGAAGPEDPLYAFMESAAASQR